MKIAGANILVVDDESHQRNALKIFLAENKANVFEAANGKEALAVLAGEPAIDVLISDLQMPEVDGMELLRHLKSRNAEVDFILVTAHGTIDVAVQAMKLGAADFLVKPIDFEELSLRLGKLLEVKKLKVSNEWLQKDSHRKAGASEVVVESAAMKKLFSEVELVLESSATILLTGETGVGKEVIARYIHDQGARAKKPFIAVNCSAIPENLLESQFFGHEKGAFTGADKAVTGCFEVADGGTLFLDEIGEMDVKLQAKILRALEERKVARVGSHNLIDVDVRIIAATNQILDRSVAEKKFREDLYFRLKTIHFNIPPLRERKEDLVPLVRAFIERYAGLAKAAKLSLKSDFIEALTEYTFPGNVRELRNIVERALLYAKGDTLDRSTLPIDLQSPATGVRVAPAALALEGSLADMVANYEKSVIEAVFRSSGHDVEMAAKQLQISRSALYAKLSKYGMS